MASRSAWACAMAIPVTAQRPLWPLRSVWRSASTACTALWPTVKRTVNVRWGCAWSSARDQRDQAQALLQAHPQRTFTVRFTVGHNAVHAVEAERHTLLNGHRGLCAVTGIAIAQAHAEREAITADAETQEDLLEIIPPIFAVPIGRPGRDQPCDWAGRLLIGPIEGDGRCILMEPGCREGIHLQGVEGDGTKDAV